MPPFDLILAIKSSKFSPSLMALIRLVRNSNVTSLLDTLSGSNPSNLFSNSLLLGLPITENAYGSTALGPNYAIIAFHAPFCYFIGILSMELCQSSNKIRNFTNVLSNIFNLVFKNPLIFAIFLG